MEKSEIRLRRTAKDLAWQFLRDFEKRERHVGTICRKCANPIDVRVKIVVEQSDVWRLADLLDQYAYHRMEDLRYGMHLHSTYHTAMDQAERDLAELKKDLDRRFGREHWA